MVLPEKPFVLTGAQAIEAVSHTPRWSEVAFDQQQVMRPQEGLIVIAYHASASREGAAPYKTHCTTTMRRLSHEECASSSISRRRSLSPRPVSAAASRGPDGVHRAAISPRGPAPAWPIWRPSRSWPPSS
nr:hypothetical protein [Sphingobium sp. SCG-1]